MFNPSRTVIDAFVATVLHTYRQAFPGADPGYPNLLEQAARMALEAMSNSDAAYHDLHHTVQVTDVGQTILWGRLMSQGDVSPHEWLHASAAMLYHDIGFVRGILKGDRGGRYVINEFGDTVSPPAGATDAYMSPYHVNRSCLFVKERFATDPLMDVATLMHYIDMTRFPVPADGFYARVGDFAGLVRAADLIGQLADPSYIQKMSRLYAEFVETGEAERLGYPSAAEMREGYPAFFFAKVRPYISEGLRFLRKTQEGQLWIANLFAHVYSEEHEEPAYGPERRLRDDPSVGHDRRAGDPPMPQIAIAND